MLYDLHLKIGGEAWNKFVIRQLDPAFEKFAKKVMEKTSIDVSIVASRHPLV